MVPASASVIAIAAARISSKSAGTSSSLISRAASSRNSRVSLRSAATAASTARCSVTSRVTEKLREPAARDSARHGGCSWFRRLPLRVTIEKRSRGTLPADTRSLNSR